MAAAWPGSFRQTTGVRCASDPATATADERFFAASLRETKRATYSTTGDGVQAPPRYRFPAGRDRGRSNLVGDEPRAL